MSKPNIKSLDKMAFTNVVPTRRQKISEAPASPLPPLSSYKANRIAAALHPARQYLKVAEVIQEAGSVRSYILVPDPGRGTEKLAYFSAGQYLSVTLKIGEATLTRPYSISSSPKEALEGRYRLSIERAPGGLASNYIQDNWQAGTEVLASAPHGEFVYEPLRDAKQVVGLAGGSSVTPFMSMAKAAAEGSEDFTLTLLYGSPSIETALFREEFAELEKSGRVKLINVTEQPAEGCEQGFITAELIRKYAPEGQYSIFFCGPRAMRAFVDKEISTLGIRGKFIRRELFGEYRNPGEDQDYPRGRGDVFTLTVRICGEERAVACDANDTLLASMEKAGIAAPARCRSGMCGFCHSQLVSGEVYVPKVVDGRRLADLKFGYVHPCCSFPISDVTIDVPPFKA